jgi:hypothetical protein
VPGCSLSRLLEVSLEGDSRHEDPFCVAADVGQDAVTHEILHMIAPEAGEVANIDGAQGEFRAELRILYHLDTP